MVAVLVLMTGLPATGKSTIAEAVARALPAAWLSADPVDAALVRGGLRPEQRPDIAGYEAMKALADLQLSAGLSVVVDAVNPFAFVRDAYADIAARHAATLIVLVTECSDRALHRARVETRAKQPWSEVERQQGYWEPYEGEALRLDAAEDAAANTQRAVAYVLGQR